MKNAYQVLNVSPSGSMAMVHSRYEEWRHACNTDNEPEFFEELTKAYNLINTPEKREQYNKELNLAKVEEVKPVVAPAPVSSNINDNSVVATSSYIVHFPSNIVEEEKFPKPHFALISRPLEEGKALKVVLIGDSKKIGPVWRSLDAPTKIGIDLCTLTDESTNVKYKIWDMAGQERFRTISSKYYSDANIILFYSSSYSVNRIQEVMEVLGANATLCEINYSRSSEEVVFKVKDQPTKDDLFKHLNNDLTLDHREIKLMQILRKANTQLQELPAVTPGMEETQAANPVSSPLEKKGFFASLFFRDKKPAAPAIASSVSSSSTSTDKVPMPKYSDVYAEKVAEHTKSAATNSSVIEPHPPETLYPNFAVDEPHPPSYSPPCYANVVTTDVTPLAPTVVFFAPTAAVPVSNVSNSMPIAPVHEPVDLEALPDAPDADPSMRIGQLDK